jgi:hypothetical protein
VDAVGGGVLTQGEAGTEGLYRRRVVDILHFNTSDQYSAFENIDRAQLHYQFGGTNKRIYDPGRDQSLRIRMFKKTPKHNLDLATRAIESL